MPPPYRGSTENGEDSSDHIRGGGGKRPRRSLVREERGGGAGVERIQYREVGRRRGEEKRGRPAALWVMERASQGGSTESGLGSKLLQGEEGAMVDWWGTLNARLLL